MIRPTSEEEVAEAVAAAKGPLDIVGGGTRRTGRSPQGETLALDGVCGIKLYEPGALTIVAAAGTPVSEIEDALSAEGQMLPFEPLDLSSVTGGEDGSTIGGVFATNASGPRRIQGGSARDYLLGVRFVDGEGATVKNGGRVMKNVTGYDLVKLMAGAHGTLGVLTEVSFKVLPKPEAVETVRLTGLSDVDAVKAMASAQGSPFDVSGAMHLPAGLEYPPVTLIRVEGFTESVAYRAGQLDERLAEFGSVHRAEGADRWDAARRLASFSTDTRGEGGAVWLVSVKPTDAPDLIAPIAKRFGCLYAFDWGGGRITVWLGPDGDQKGLHTALQAATAETGGHARLLNGPPDLADAVPIFQPEAAPIAKLSSGLRARFDPRGILNPGLMG